jgi:hypothetical protein
MMSDMLSSIDRYGGGALFMTVTPLYCSGASAVIHDLREGGTMDRIDPAV